MFIHAYAHPIEKIQKYYEIYSILLPMCIVGMAVEVCKYCSRVFG
jgi:hypothetical protein